VLAGVEVRVANEGVGFFGFVHEFDDAGIELFDERAVHVVLNTPDPSKWSQRNPKSGCRKLGSLNRA
jgi:hypothetical protein